MQLPCTTINKIKRLNNMKLELIVPTKLSEIPLKHYQKFLGIAKNTNDEVFLAEKMIQCFCGIELKEVVKIQFKEIEALSHHFAAMFKQKPEFKNRFKIAGVEFGFIPNLDDITLGEFSDLDNYFGKWDKMHNAMAVLYRPITDKSGDKYLIQDYNGSITYCDVMKQMPLDVVLGAMVFFYNLSNELLISSLNYLEMNPQVQAMIDKHNSDLSGDGIALSMLSLKEMLEDLMKYRSFSSQLHLHS